MNCPCVDCMIIPICKNKSPNYVLHDCDLLRQYLRYSFHVENKKEKTNLIIEEINKRYKIFEFQKQTIAIGG